MPIQKASVKDIVQIIKKASPGEVRFAVLLGAGASASAGVPLASQMIKELKREIYKREKSSSTPSEEEIDGWIKEQNWYKAIPTEELYDREYSAVFEKYALSRPDRQAYIADCVKKAPNWAHIYLANLVKNKCIQTILTTNFDDLAFKALFQQGQEVVTCPRREHFSDVLFSSKCPRIIHLHGHYLNYDIKNLEVEVKDLPDEFVNLFRQIVSENGLIVVGYGGRKEFVMELLLKFKEEDHFKHNLYWVAHRGEGTLSNLPRKLLEYPYSFLIEECDADNFFLQLNQGLNLGFPPFLQDPLGNLIDTLEPLKGLELLKSREFSKEPHTLLINKIDRLREFHRQEKKREEKEQIKEQFLLLYEQGKIEDATKKLEDALKKFPKDAWFNFAYGTLLVERGKEENLRKSLKYFQLATKYKPDDHEAYYIWGTALSDLGKTVGGKEGQGLVQQSFKKYQLATKYKPDFNEAYYNWGIALCRLGYMTGGKKGEELIRQSFEKYELAIKYRPDKYEVYNTWGETMLNLGYILSEKERKKEESEKLIRQSFEKFQLATKYKYDYHFAYNHWGNALSGLGEMLGGKEGQELIRQSFEKYRLATKYKPDFYGAYLNWHMATKKLVDLLPAEAKYEKKSLKKEAQELLEKWSPWNPLTS